MSDEQIESEARALLDAMKLGVAVGLLDLTKNVGKDPVAAELACQMLEDAAANELREARINYQMAERLIETKGE